ncbi:MAG: prepilin peptidase [Olsenella sp.]|nr:prepilin peptidase [Olsenella sp.]
MLFATPITTAYALLVTFLLGLVMGSFLNCLAWRLTHGESVLRGRSHCATCGHVLAARDLVPVASWLLSRGRCRYCGERISVRYPVTELVCAVAYVTIVVRYGLTLEALEMLAFASILLVLSLTDIDEYVIPNACIVLAVIVRVAYVLCAGSLGLLPSGVTTSGVLVSSFVSALAVGAALVVVALVMDRVLGRESVGGGDVKLLAVAALYFGWQQCLLLIIVACVIGIAFGASQARPAAEGEGPSPAPSGSEPGEAAAGRGDSEEGDADANADADAGTETGTDADIDSHAFPWGPSIALACWFCMLFGRQIIDWYLGLFL